MQSGLLVSLFSLRKLRLAITASGTAARSPKLATLSSPVFGRQSRRVARLAEVSKQSDATVIRRFLSPQRNVYYRVKKRTKMNPYEKLEHETRAWTVEETAVFLGYSPKYVYRLIHEGKIEGWMKVEGGDYRFCPAKLKAWMEKKFNGTGKPPKPDALPDKHPGKEDDESTSSSNQPAIS
jgi:excisionase family DNA binding protein